VSQSFVLHGNDPGRERVASNLCDFVRALDPKKAYRITVEAYRKRRSDDQNAALWGLAYPTIAKATGQDDVNEWHEYMLGEHFGWVESNLFGKRKLRPARTTTTGFNGEACTLSTAEFAEFFDFIQRRAAQNGIFIPDPDPFWREQARA
jgi:hypothetical protein